MFNRCFGMTINMKEGLWKGYASNKLVAQKGPHKLDFWFSCIIQVLKTYTTAQSKLFYQKLNAARTIAATKYRTSQGPAPIKT